MVAAVNTRRILSLNSYHAKLAWICSLVLWLLLFSSSGIFRGGAFGDGLPRVAHRNFSRRNLQAQCMDVWCEAFCCRHINFKTVFHSASEHAIFIGKNEQFSEETPPGPLGAYGPSTRAPWAPNLWPLSKILNTSLFSRRRLVTTARHRFWVSVGSCPDKIII